MTYADETMDVVNIRDEVIGEATQTQMYAHKFLHRIVHVMVQNSAGLIGIQQRSATKSYKPLHWATGASGHVQKGESYEAAAQRELEEELGLKGKLQWKEKLFYTDPERPGLNMFLGVFVYVTDEEPRLQTEEVEDFKYVTRQELTDMLQKGEKFHPELLFILKELYTL